MPATATPTAAGVSQPGASNSGSAVHEGEVDADRHRQQRQHPQRQQHRGRRIVRVHAVRRRRRRAASGARHSPMCHVRGTAAARRTRGTRRGTCRTPSGTPRASAATNGPVEAAGPAPRRGSLPSTGSRRRAGCPPATACRSTKTIAVCGIRRARPPMCGRSLLPTAWITAPAPRKSSALNTPCVSRWKKPAAEKPAPIAVIM